MEYENQLDEIYPIPQIPPEIKEAVSNERLVVFIGAGASRIIGCSGWKEIAIQLVDTAHENNWINFQEKEKIIEEYGPRKTITILKRILPEELYRNTLKKSLTAKGERLNKYPIYEELFKMRGVYLTTNVDTYFTRYFEPAKTFIYLHQLDRKNIKPLSLFHLHGSLNNFSTIIFATQEYINHYNRKEMRNFLEYVFNTNFTVLFVGYSLSELEILDYVLLKGNSGELKHFILLPFYKTEKNMFKFEQQYFAGMNVLAIPYAIDEKGHEQLYHVVESWEKEINITSPFLYKSYQFIEQNINDYVEENAVEIFQLIKNDEHFRNHFFKNVNTVKWLSPLKEKGYFAPEKAPAPIPADQEGYFTISQWNILPYLERVSQQVNISGNEKYIDELLTIIKDVSNYRDASGQHIDNYRTWWYFVKILLNIPNEKIPLEIIELIPIWLDSKFDTTLQGSDIATELLPKFLTDVLTTEDIQKAEKIIASITAIKTFPLNKKGAKLVGRNEEIRLVVDPHWLKKAFNKYSEIIGQKCTSKVIEDLAKKIRVILKKRVSKVSFEADDKTYLLVLTEDDSNYVVKVLIVEGNLFEELLAERENDGAIVKRLLIDKCEKNIFVNKVHQDLIKEFQKAESNTLKRKIQSLYLNLYDNGTYESFYEESNYPISDPLELFTFTLKRIIDAKAKNDVNSTKVILRDFLKDNYLYFSKMAIYTIGRNIGNYNDLFWELLDKDINGIILEGVYWSDELKHLLRNLRNLSDEQRKKLKDKIEEGPKRYIPEEDTEKYIASWKQRLYQALSFEPYFKKLYEEKKDITKEDVELRPLIGERVVTHLSPGTSPLTKEEILQMPNRKISEFLSTFKPEDFRHGPTIDGLSDELRKAVQEQPEKFISELSPFLNTFYIYICDILWGIKDAWNNKKSIEWEKLFDFIKQYINRDKFWQDKLKMFDDHKTHHKWFVGMIGELIQEGTKDDNWAISEAHLLAAQEIISIIIDNLKEDEKEVVEPVTQALNSAFGKMITALIYLALQIARIEDKKSEKREVKWNNELKNRYEKTLDYGVIEAYTLLGRYMPNLYYLDKSWVEQNIKKFESIKQEQLWSAFMNGYLSGDRIYNNLYKLMREHYLKAISYPFKEKHAEELLVQHVAVGYLRDIGDLSENSLIGIILRKWNPSHIKGIIDFFWMQKDYLVKSADKDAPVLSSDEKEKLKNKIIEFWKWLYEKYKDKDKDKDKESLTEDDKKILSDASKLSIFLRQIDSETFEWMKLSTPHIHIDFNSPFFIECLDELKDKGDKLTSGKYIGAIFLEILNFSTPDYDQKHIRSIVEYLYGVKDAETIDSANKICNIYGSSSRGLEFLRDIYEKNKDLKAK